MIEYIGHVVVAVVVGCIVLATTVTKTKVSEIVVATMQERAGKKMTLDVAAAIERDLRNMGSNFPTYDLEPDSAVMSWVTDSTSNYFQFLGQVSPGQPPATIKYVWEIVDSTSVNGKVKPLYQISRYVDGTLSGMSARNFTNVSISIENTTGDAAAEADEVRKIDVELSAVSGLGSSDIMPETRWHGVYRPQALARQDADDV